MSNRRTRIRTTFSRGWARVAMVGVVATVGAVVVAAPAAHANIPQGATITVSPSMNLPDNSSTSVKVVGNGLDANTMVVVDECATMPGSSDCDELSFPTTDANGDVSSAVDVSYTLLDGTTCDSDPPDSVTCDVDVVYANGNDAGQVAATAPLTFAGHDGPAPTLTFDTEGQPVDTQVDKTMTEPDHSAAHILVDAVDAEGTLNTDFTGAVTISFSQPNSAEFVSGKPAVHSSSLTVDAVDGVADFSPIVIDTVGFGDTLVANSDGLAQSAPSSSFDVAAASTDCAATKTCTVRTKSPETGQSATVKAVGGEGTQGTVVTATFGGNVATLNGCTEPADGILTFSGNRLKVIRLTIATTTYIGTFCWGQPDPFIDQTGQETTYFSSANQDYEGVLGFCSATIPGPCINKITVKGASETVQVTGGDDDPHMSH